MIKRTLIIGTILFTVTFMLSSCGDATPEQVEQIDTLVKQNAEYAEHLVELKQKYDAKEITHADYLVSTQKTMSAVAANVTVLKDLKNSGLKWTDILMSVMWSIAAITASRGLPSKGVFRFIRGWFGGTMRAK